MQIALSIESLVDVDAISNPHSCVLNIKPVK